MAFVLVAGVGLGACAGSTPSGLAYTLRPDREIEATVHGEQERVHELATRILQDRLGYTILGRRVDAREGTVEARTIAGDLVRVETLAASSGSTRVQVFVGPLGDESAAKAVLNELHREIMAQAK